VFEELFGGMDSAQDQEVTPESWRQGLRLAGLHSHVKAPGRNKLMPDSFYRLANSDGKKVLCDKA
jgi:hypothetical protein